MSNMEDISTVSPDTGKEHSSDDSVPARPAIAELLGQAKALITRLYFFRTEQLVDLRTNIFIRFGSFFSVEIVILGIYILTSKEIIEKSQHISQGSFKVAFLLLACVVAIVFSVSIYSQSISMRQRAQKAELLSKILEGLISRSESQFRLLNFKSNQLQIKEESRDINLRNEIARLHAQQEQYLAEMAKLRHDIMMQSQKSDHTQDELITSLNKDLQDIKERQLIDLKEIDYLKSLLAESKNNIHIELQNEDNLAAIRKMQESLIDMQMHQNASLQASHEENRRLQQALMEILALTRKTERP